jgi:hypothetical protein
MIDEHRHDRIDQKAATPDVKESERGGGQVAQNLELDVQNLHLCDSHRPAAEAPP